MVVALKPKGLLPVLATGANVPAEGLLVKLPALESCLVLISSGVAEIDAPAVAAEEPNLNIDAAGNEGVAGVDIDILPLLELTMVELVAKVLLPLLVNIEPLLTF